MSDTWTEQQLQAVSKAMKAFGFLSYEEFCVELEKRMTELTVKEDT